MPSNNSFLHTSSSSDTSGGSKLLEIHFRKQELSVQETMVLAFDCKCQQSNLREFIPKYSLPGQTADLIPLAMKSTALSPLSTEGIFWYVMDVSPASPKTFSISLCSKPCLCGTRWLYSSGTADIMSSMTMRAPEGLRKWAKSRVTWETSSKWWYDEVHCIQMRVCVRVRVREFFTHNDHVEFFIV